MNATEIRFLEAVKASLQNQAVTWTDELPPQDWIALFRMADVHRVLPMVYEAVYRSPAARSADPQMLQSMKRRTMQAVMYRSSFPRLKRVRAST